MNQIASTGTDVVYRRTTKGQAMALLWSTSIKDADQRKLLLMVNGFTPLQDLAKVGGIHAHARDIADMLVVAGLIEPVLDNRPRAARVLDWDFSAHCHP